MNRVVEGDCVVLLRAVPDASIHLILSDIPYGIGADSWDVLHENTNSAFLGASPAQRRAGDVFKRRGKPLNGWSEADRAIPQQYQEWCSTWATEWFRVLTPGATALVFAGRRLQHRCIIALEDAGFTFKDMVGWLRPRAPHRAQRASAVFDRRGDAENAAAWSGWRVGNLRPLFEPILWFIKPYPIGTTITDNLLTHGVGAYNQEAYRARVGHFDNWLSLGFEPGEAGLHPTQKPVRLLEALIELTTAADQVVLDPFAGSGSTLVAARNLGRRYLGFEADRACVEVAERRLDHKQLRLLEASGSLYDD